MSTTLGIYEPFKPYVRQQLEERRKILEEGGTNSQRNEEFYAYTVAKRCVITMISGVDLKDSAKDTFLEEDEKPKKTGNGLARQYILQGGTQHFDQDGNFGGQREGFHSLSEESDKTRSFAYGDRNIRANADDGYGIVPMPGITDATIATKSKEGALREATVNFVAHNRRQLAVLELLYMRPGMPVLLEWQWTPFIANDGSIETAINSTIDEFLNANSDLDKINDMIRLYKVISGGNYDGFVGYCKNFSIKAREDGGFDCTTEIMAHGDLIESLTIGKDIFKNNNGYYEVIDKFYKYLFGIYKTAYIFDDRAIFEKIRDERNISVAGRPDLNVDVDNRYPGVGTIPLQSDQTSAQTTNILQDIQVDKFSAGNIEVEGDESITYEDLKNFQRNSLYLNAYKEIEDLYKEINKITSLPLTEELDDKQTGKGYQTFLGGTILKQIVREESTKAVLDDNFPHNDASSAYQKHGLNNNVFIRWDLLCQIFNHKVTDQYKEGKPIFELSYVNNGAQTYHPRNEQEVSPTGDYFYIPYSAPEDIPTSDVIHQVIKKDKSISLSNNNFHPIIGHSYDYNVCLLPHMELFSKNLNKYKKGIETVAGFNAQNNTQDIDDSNKKIDFKTELSSYSNVDKEKMRINSVGFIYFNVEYLLDEYTKMRFENTSNETGESSYPKLNNSFNPFDFFKRIWDGVNDACANYYNFDLITEHERPHVVKVVEKTLSGIVNENIFEFNPQGLTSITRDFIYDSSISNDFASAVSIAAQAPDNEHSLAGLTYKAFNKNIKSRFSRELTKDEKEIQDTLLKNELRKDVDRYYGIVYAINRYLYNLAQADVSTYISTINFTRSSRETLTPSQAKQAAQELEELRIKIDGRYPLSHPQAGYYREILSNQRATFVPLNFSIKMDGIGGLIPYQIFKVNKNKLPIGYEADEIAFIIFNESNQIDSTGDWSTSFSGQLVLLPNFENFNNDGENAPEDLEQVPDNVNEADKEDKKFEGFSTPQNQLPLDGWTNPILHDVRVTSPWGRERGGERRHKGIDLGASVAGTIGDPVVSAAEGKVFQIIDNNTCGKGVFIEHPTTISITGASRVATRYCHLDTVTVEYNQNVAIGQQIGTLGNTGRSQAAHLHYEVYDGDQENLKEVTKTWSTGWGTLSNGVTIATTGTTDPALYLSTVNQFASAE